MAVALQLRLLIETDCIDNERIAVPIPHGIAEQLGSGST
jgi:hypothetical protein